jgi:hypothetical protein
MQTREGSTAKRILVPIVPDIAADYTAAAMSAARIARKTGGIVRLAYLAPLPPPRVDRHDRVVADTDREMSRIGAGAHDRLDALVTDMDGVEVETVVRFGRPGRELSIEAAAFEADLITLATPLRFRRWEGVRAWRIRRAAIGSRVPLLLLPLPAGGGDALRGGAIAMPALR